MAKIEYLPEWGWDIRITIANLFIHWSTHTDSKKLLTFWFHNFKKAGGYGYTNLHLRWAFVVGVPFRDLVFIRSFPSLIGVSNGA